MSHNNTNSINDLKDKFVIIKNKGWIESINRGTSSSGVLFEQMLGIDKNIFAIPDFENIEIKTKINNALRQNICLFNATPDSYLFEIQRLVEKYGYPDKTLPQYNVLNINVNAINFKKISNKYLFKLFVDYKYKKIVLQITNINEKSVDRLTYGHSNG